MLSMNDAIAIALADNLDIAIARYNLPIADTDILRTKAGGAPLGVKSAWFQTLRVPALAASATGMTGAGAGGTTAGAGGAGTGAGRYRGIHQRCGSVA